MADTPESHHGESLVLGESCPSACICSCIAGVGDGHGDLSKGKHVAVGIVAWLCVLAPCISFGKDGINGTPAVPEVVHHAPHIGILQTLLGVGVLGFSWTQ